jgi:ABC-type lipoprotein release transport system permease subunit
MPLRILTRLTLADLRRHRLAATLNALVIAVAAATLTLSIAVGRLGDDPWQRTFEATNGAHVLVSGPDRATVERLAEQPGVSAASPAIPATFSSFEHDGRTIGVVAFGVPRTGSPVAEPYVTERRWVGARGEIVLERSFARYYELAPGDRLALATASGRVPLDVVGVAVTASQERYPESQPGAAFVAPGTLARIRPDESAWQYTLGVRLDDPSRSGEVASRVADAARRVFTEDWQEQRTTATEDTRTIRIILTVFAVFLLLASGFVIANQVGARVLGRLREIGVLKAVGLTPGQVASVFAAQQLVPTVAAVAVGVPVGILAAPLALGPSEALLDATGAPVGPAGGLVVALAVLAAVALVALVPTWVAARRSTTTALAGARARVRTSRLAAGTARLRLPVPLALGLRDSFARRGRAALTASSLVLSVIVVIAALSMEASFAREDAQSRAFIAEIEADPPAFGIGPAWDVFEDQSAERAQFRLIVYGLNAVLLLIALANLLTTALLSVRERVRDLGILKAVGLTPREVGASVMTAHGLLGGLAALLGIPLGIGFFLGVYGLANGSLDDVATPPWWQLALIVPGAALVVALVAGAPARIASRIRVVDALRYE